MDTMGVVARSVQELADVPHIFRLPKLNGLDLFEVTVDQLQDHYRKGRLTSTGYVRFCLERIRAVRFYPYKAFSRGSSKRGHVSPLQVDPYLESVIECNPDAEKIAEELDDERQQGKIRGPLHGIPVLVKDVRFRRPKSAITVHN